MSPRSAVQQAVDLLSQRLDEAQRAHHELGAEIETITRALRDLRAYSTAPYGQEPPPPVTVTTSSGTMSTGNASVRATVKAILDNNNHAFTPAEVRALIPEAVMEGKSKDQRVNTVRTALWSLRQKGEAILLDEKRTISSTWVQDSENPSASTEGFSGDTQLENRGGDNDHDHPNDFHSQGHDHLVE